jgi:hypothetical protein
MFEAYKIRPVVETEGNDESKYCQSFSTLKQAMDFIVVTVRTDEDAELRDGWILEDAMEDMNIRLFWTLYGVNPLDQGVRVSDAIADMKSEMACYSLLSKIVGRYIVDSTGYIYPLQVKTMDNETLFDLAVMLGGDLATRNVIRTGILEDSRSHQDTLIEWANEFNNLHRNREWDGEYMEAIEDFYEDKVKSVKVERGAGSCK